MIGHSREDLNKVYWPDAEIDLISIDFDELTIHLTESSQKKTTIRCQGYIGYTLLGFWDEIIIRKVELRDTDELLDACIHSLKQRYGDELPESGNSVRNRRSYHALEIELIDGAIMKIVAADFIVD